MSGGNPRIAPRPAKPGSGVDNFIEAAPDGALKANPRNSKSVKNKPISHSMPPDLLVDVEEAAEQLGISRAAFINMAASEKAKAVLGK